MLQPRKGNLKSSKPKKSVRFNNNVSVVGEAVGDALQIGTDKKVPQQLANLQERQDKQNVRELSDLNPDNQMTKRVTDLNSQFNNIPGTNPYLAQEIKENAHNYGPLRPLATERNYQQVLQSVHVPDRKNPTVDGPILPAANDRYGNHVEVEPLNKVSTGIVDDRDLLRQQELQRQQMSLDQQQMQEMQRQQQELQVKQQLEQRLLQEQMREQQHQQQIMMERERQEQRLMEQHMRQEQQRRMGANGHQQQGQRGNLQSMSRMGGGSQQDLRSMQQQGQRGNLQSMSRMGGGSQQDLRSMQQQGQRGNMQSMSRMGGGSQQDLRSMQHQGQRGNLQSMSRMGGGSMQDLSGFGGAVRQASSMQNLRRPMQRPATGNGMRQNPGRRNNMGM